MLFPSCGGEESALMAAHQWRLSDFVVHKGSGS